MSIDAFRSVLSSDCALWNSTAVAAIFPIHQLPDSHNNHHWTRYRKPHWGKLGDWVRRDSRVYDSLKELKGYLTPKLKKKSHHQPTLMLFQTCMSFTKEEILKNVGNQRVNEGTVYRQKNTKSIGAVVNCPVTNIL